MSSIVFFFNVLIFSLSASARPILFQIHRPHPLNTSFEPAMEEIVRRFNASHPASPVQLRFSGNENSTLNQVLSSIHAGEVPDLFTLEDTERPPLKGYTTRPFLRFHGVVFWNDEILFRLSLTQSRSQGSFSELIAILSKAKSGLPQKTKLIGFPASRSEDLVFLEALCPVPLFSQGQGGVRSNRNAATCLSTLFKGLQSLDLKTEDFDSQQVFQSFIDQKRIAWIGSSELIPRVQKSAEFKLSILNLPQISAPKSDRTNLIWGSNLAVKSQDPDVKIFVDYLYSRSVQKELQSASGSSPEVQQKQSRSRAQAPDLHKARDLYFQLFRTRLNSFTLPEPPSLFFTSFDSQLPY